jgi:hypothetical protein
VIFICYASTPTLTSATPSSLHSCPVICGTHGLGTPVMTILVRFFIHLIFIVPKTITCAMPVVLAKMLDFLFSESNKVATFTFIFLHCDVWTSPVVSNWGFKYYLIFLDDFTHYVWTFQLRHKLDVLATFVVSCFCSNSIPLFHLLSLD